MKQAAEVWTTKHAFNTTITKPAAKSDFQRAEAFFHRKQL